MYGCTGSSLLHMGFLYLPVGATLCRHVRTTHSHCGAFSCCGAWVPEHAGSVVVMHKLSCSEARGISPDQGLNPCLLYWRAGEPLDHQGSPHTQLTLEYTQLKQLRKTPSICENLSSLFSLLKVFSFQRAIPIKCSVSFVHNYHFQFHMHICFRVVLLVVLFVLFF